MSAPRRTISVAPGITPRSTALVKSLLNLTPSQRPVPPQNCRYRVTAGSIKVIRRAAESISRRHPERNRKILGAMARLDAVQHRAPEAGGLLGGEARDHPALLLVAIDRANRTEHDPSDAAKRASLAQLHEHPIDSIRLLAGVFEKQNAPVEARLDMACRSSRPAPTGSRRSLRLPRAQDESPRALRARSRRACRSADLADARARADSSLAQNPSRPSAREMKPFRRNRPAH